MGKDIKELIKKFKIDTKSLEEEQKKIGKLATEKDSIDFDQIQYIGGIDTTTSDKDIIGSVVTLNPNLEVIEERYSKKRVPFPYIPGFLAFRELPVLIEVYKKLEVKPDVMFLGRHGTLHQNGCGLATHFGVATDCATIGIAKDLLVGEIKGDKVYLNGKIKGMLVVTKKPGKPLIVSVGHKISLKMAVELTKKFIKPPHKFPEPIAQAHKFANKVKTTLGSQRSFK